MVAACGGGLWWRPVVVGYDYHCMVTSVGIGLVWGQPVAYPVGVSCGGILWGHPVGVP